MLIAEKKKKTLLDICGSLIHPENPESTVRGSLCKVSIEASVIGCQNMVLENVGVPALKLLEGRICWAI